METTTSQKQTTGKDVYTIITEKIIEQLEKGTVPWQKPWHEAGLPKNLISGKSYRGVNVMLLASHGYEHNLFLSFKQLQDIGASVKKDEKGHQVIYWNYPQKQEQAEAEVTEEVPEPKKTGTLKYYTVFNVAQCENVPEDLFETARIPVDTPSCVHILENMPDNVPLVRHKENKAYYNPLEDFINMPKQKSFKTDDGYFSTLFHELVHSTGHHSRLSRPTLIEMSEFGSDAYSMEELTAEIGTCYLQSYTGIESQFDNSIVYIQGWLWMLKNDKRLIISAAYAAQKAVDYILNFKPEIEEIQG